MLILASNSPTRQALLRQAGIAFSIRTEPVDERALEAAIIADGGDPADVALGLAAAKARAVSNLAPDAKVIGGDQTLALDGTVLHKPANLDEVRRQLMSLRGRRHALHSAVALAEDGEIVWSKLATAYLTMREFTDAERDRVLTLDGEAALASVGGYRLEGPAIQLFSHVEGDYFAILGLPLLELLQALRLHAPDLLRVVP